LAPTLDPGALRLHALAAALAAQAATRSAAPVLRSVASGFRNNPGPPAVRRFTAGDTELAVGYRLGRAPRFTVTSGDAPGAPGDGTVTEILVEVGRQVDIDQVIAVITGDDDGDGGEPPGG